MDPFIQHTGIAAPILQDNVDTDQIIPSREMTRVSKTGLGEGLFAGLRYRYDGASKVGLVEDFVLNQQHYQGASILLSGRNFGCGSSREHAVWALKDFGIRAIIAESFGAIFRMNCARNGLLAIDLPHSAIAKLAMWSDRTAGDSALVIDLQHCTVGVSPEDDASRTFEFSIDPADRHMLINGLDFIDFTLQQEDQINQFIVNYRASTGWAFLQPS